MSRSPKPIRPPREGDQVGLDTRFVVLPLWLLDRGVSSRAIHVYALLYALADRDTRVAWPSRRYLADRLGLDGVSTVDRAVRELIAARAITRRPRYDHTGSQRSSVYVVHAVPADHQDPAPRVTTPRVTSGEGGVDNVLGVVHPPTTGGGGPLSPVVQIPSNQLPNTPSPTSNVRTGRARSRGDERIQAEGPCEHGEDRGARYCAVCRRHAQARATLEERAARIRPPHYQPTEEVDL